MKSNDSLATARTMWLAYRLQGNEIRIQAGWDFLLFVGMPVFEKQYPSFLSSTKTRILNHNAKCTIKDQRVQSYIMHRSRTFWIERTDCPHNFEEPSLFPFRARWKRNQNLEVNRTVLSTVQCWLSDRGNPNLYPWHYLAAKAMPNG